MDQAWHVEASIPVTFTREMVRQYVLVGDTLVTCIQEMEVMLLQGVSIPVTCTQEMDQAWHVEASIPVTFTREMVRQSALVG
jgi:hypothetical protein